VAPLGGERVIVAPLAHAGHWLAQLAYLAPLAVLVVVLVMGKLRARRQRAAPAARPDERRTG
jgi:hypothetical protein